VPAAPLSVHICKLLRHGCALSLALQRMLLVLRVLRPLQYRRRERSPSCVRSFSLAYNNTKWRSIQIAYDNKLCVLARVVVVVSASSYCRPAAAPHSCSDESARALVAGSPAFVPTTLPSLFSLPLRSQLAAISLFASYTPACTYMRHVPAQGNANARPFRSGRRRPIPHLTK
jgi:hypothetical protein